jgi:small ligand-binding sensory domain FIST
MAGMTRPTGDVGARVLLAGSGLGLGGDAHAALRKALEGALAPLRGEAPDLVLLFASSAYGDTYADLLVEAARRSRSRHIVGCSASAVIEGQREVEDQPAISAMAVRLPMGSLLSVRHVTSDAVSGTSAVDMPANDCKGLLVLADPFSTDVAELVGVLERDYPGVPIMGGMATGDQQVRETFLFCDERVVSEGAVVVGLGGAARLRPVVSQGCEPIGEPWTITDAERNIVKSIGGRPAYQVLVDTVQKLDRDKQQRVNGNLLVGLAMDEYRDEFKRGDFLIRNLMGVDQSSGAIAIAALAQVGQTIQFQIRDARAADEELRAMLGAVSDEPAGAALLFACNGRGVGLFGAPDHDARTVRELLGPLPLAGLFCNGEIGPVGRRTFVHGFTASLALIAAAD